MQALGLGAVGGIDLMPLQGSQQLADDLTGIAQEHGAIVFGGVELTDVDVDKLDTCVLKGRFGGGGKVAVARTNANHHIGVAGNPVGRKGAGHADGAQVKRVVVAQAALASHRLADGDAGGVDELGQHAAGVAINHAAAGHNHRALGRFDDGGCPADGRPIGAQSADVPDALFKQRRIVIEGLGLHVLGQC